VLGLLLVLSLFILILLISVPFVSGIFNVTYLIAAVFTPLLLVSWSWLFHSLISYAAKLTDINVSLSDSSKIALLTWLFIAIMHLRKTRSISLLGEYRLAKSAILIAVISVTGWSFSIGLGGGPPRDNDVLSNAFIQRRTLSMVNTGFCIVSGDVSRYENLRLEPCGSAILAHFANHGNQVGVDSMLNFPYLLAALLLPIGAIAGWQVLKKTNEGSYLVGLVAISFLIYPYAVNGLMRMTLGLVFVIPFIAMLTEINQLRTNQLFLLGIGLIGLGFTHLLPLAIVVCYWIVQSLLSFFVSLVRSKARLTLTALKPLTTLGFILPSLKIFVATESNFSAIKNVISASASASASTSTSASTIETVVGFVQKVLLKTDWARPQPVLVLLTLAGLFLLVKEFKFSGVGYLLTVAGLFGLLVVSVIFGRGNFFYEFLFVSNWYRLVAVLEILMVIPAALALNKAHIEIKNYLMYSTLICVICLFTFVNVGTGFSIVKTAWQRGNGTSKEVIESFDVLKNYINLRTLNNPMDGSSWSYARVGMNITSPNDRDADKYFGSFIDKLGDDQLQNEVCNVILEQNIEAVLWVNGSIQKIKLLLNQGILDQLLVNKDHIVLGRLSNAFIDSCST
jgi:hypothetical protein